MELETLQPRRPRGYSDVLYQVRAMAMILYPYFKPGWDVTLWRTAGIEVEIGEDPTLSQLYLVEAWLLDELQKMHEATEKILEGKKDELSNHGA